MTRGAVTPEPIQKLVAAWSKEGVSPEIIKGRLDLPGEERVGGRTVERIISRSKRTGSVAGIPCRRRVQSRKMQRISAHLQRMVQLAPMMYLEDRSNWLLHVSKELGTSKQRISEVLKGLRISRTVVERAAKERRAEQRADFMIEQRRIEDYSNILFVDEISKDDRLHVLKAYGYKGTCCSDSSSLTYCATGETVRAIVPFFRGQRWQTFAAYNAVRGFCGWSHIKGSFDEETCVDAYATAVVPNVYHNTIVVIDGARTHDMDLLEQMIRHRGGKLLCLPPYSPDFNAIELAFGRVKAWLRKHHHWVLATDPR